MARYKGELVFIEEKHCTAPWGQLGQLSILKARIDSIVVCLQNPDKPVELRTLPCLGGAYKPAKSAAGDTTTWTYSIVYRANYPGFISLQEILSRRAKTPEDVKRDKAQLPLGKRFVLAQKIARAIMYLHLANWLHKAVRSENVMFFVDNESVPIDSPYLIGFKHSRLDVAGEQTENINKKPDYKYYRHPKAMSVPVADLKQPLGGPGRYSKLYDIYSLGVVLLEIGLFVPAGRIVGKHLEAKDQTSEETLKVLVEKATPDLRFAMGDAYADAALACLDGSLDNFDKELLHQQFYKTVVCKLDLCKA
ncbi:hypothetical protein GQ53DRAFT_825359 [Thozetella sp. PMI_491]|nr:hypothetical protein GQ53DRAFT_825359 [Thozetella sp. PMI_491]